MDTEIMDSQPSIPYAKWPQDAPSALERNIITIVCGNTRLHWALHEGCVNKFIPIMFWYTMHDDGDEESSEGRPCDILEAHVASQAHALIFGEKNGGKKGNTQSVSQTAARRDAPGISVFIVSSNPTMEHKICHMFKDVPAKLFKLRNTDFFTTAQGVYPTMGVDRVAALYGARLHYGEPTLVIDGGTAMTYTMLDAGGNIRGGGISPGVSVRLQSLCDYTGSLPAIDHNKFRTLVEEAIATKTPLPFFAKDTETAMISPICAELSCQLRNIIKQYVSRCQSSPEAIVSASLISNGGVGTSEITPNISKQKQHQKQKRFPVVITGGDGKILRDLLQADASGIISVEPDASPVQEHTIEIRHVKNLVTYALGDVLYEKFSLKPRNDPEENLRLKIQGLRIATPAIDQKEPFSRGCVFNITPEVMIEGYIFHARFDNGVQKDLTLKELYDSLVLYNEIGECVELRKSTALDEEEDWVTEKKSWSKKVQEELGSMSRLIKNRMRQLKPHIEKEELAKIFKKKTSIAKAISRKSKKAKLSTNSNSSNPSQLIGKRFAKIFPIDVEGTVRDDVFFGTVKYISDDTLKWYFVCYDDGDSEDLGIKEIIEGIDLYEVHKSNDSKRKDENSSSARNGDSQQLPKHHSESPHNTEHLSLHNDMEDDQVSNYTDLTTLLGSALKSNELEEIGDRQISDFKEDI